MIHSFRRDVVRESLGVTGEQEESELRGGMCRRGRVQCKKKAIKTLLGVMNWKPFQETRGKTRV